MMKLNRTLIFTLSVVVFFWCVLELPSIPFLGLELTTAQARISSTPHRTPVRGTVVSVPPASRIGSTPYRPPTHITRSVPVIRLRSRNHRIHNFHHGFGHFIPYSYYSLGYGYSRSRYPTISTNILWPNYGSIVVNPVIPSVVVEKKAIETWTPIRPVVSPVRVAGHRDLVTKLLQSATHIRRQAARELAEFESISSVAVLVDTLINDADADVRKTAAKSLGEIGEPAAYLALLRCEQFEQNELVKTAASLAIEEIKAKQNGRLPTENLVLIPMNDGRSELADQLETLRFGRPDQRLAAVKRLGRFTGTQSAAALVDALINDPDKLVRNQAAIALGLLADPLATPFLLFASDKDPEYTIRLQAKKVVEKIQAHWLNKANENNAR